MTRATARIINFAGDSELFTFLVDPGQTITVVGRADSSSLQPSIELRDPLGALLGSGTAAAAGASALVQAAATTFGGIYTVQVQGAAGTTGSYTIEVYLNAAR